MSQEPTLHDLYLRLSDLEDRIAAFQTAVRNTLDSQNVLLEANDLHVLAAAHNRADVSEKLCTEAIENIQADLPRLVAALLHETLKDLTIHFARVTAPRKDPPPCDT